MSLIQNLLAVKPEGLVDDVLRGITLSNRAAAVTTDAVIVAPDFVMRT